MERYVVHMHLHGADQVIGSFRVEHGSIHFDSMADEMNCSMFPAGPIAGMTGIRLRELLNHPSKTVYLTRG